MNVVKYDELIIPKDAEGKTEIEKAYRNLERVGMDRITANVLLRGLKNETLD